MRVVANPKSVLFPDTATGSTNTQKIYAYQERLLPDTNDITIQSPFTFMPSYDSSFVSSKTSDTKLFRNYVIKDTGTATITEVLDILDSGTKIYRLSHINDDGDDRVVLDKIDKSLGTVDASVEVLSEYLSVTYIGKQRKYMLFDDDGNVVVVLNKKISIEYFVEVVIVSSTTHVVLDTQSEQFVPDQYVTDIGHSGDWLIFSTRTIWDTTGYLFSTEMYTSTFDSFKTSKVNAIKVLPAYYDGADIVVCGCINHMARAGRVLIVSHDARQGSPSFVPLGASNNGTVSGGGSPPEVIAVDSKQQGFYTKLFSTSESTINRFDLLRAVRGDTYKDGYAVQISNLPTSIGISDFAFEMKFMSSVVSSHPTTLLHLSSRVGDIGEVHGDYRFKIDISEAGVSVEYWDSGTSAWVVMVSSSAISEYRDLDATTLYIERNDSNVWYCTLNGEEVALTDGAGASSFPGIITQDYPNAGLLGYNDHANYVRSISFSTGGTKIISHVFDGSFVDARGVAFTNYVEALVPFREYSLEVFADDEIINSVLSGEYLYVLRGENSGSHPAVSAIKYTLDTASVFSSSDDIVSDDSGIKSEFEYALNMVISTDGNIYLGANRDDSTDTASYIMKIDENLSFVSNGYDIDIKYSPSSAGFSNKLMTVAGDESLTVETVSTVALTGFAFVQATRYVPYGTIVMGSGHADYHRLNRTNPYTVDVSCYKRVSSWGKEPAPAGTRYNYSASTGTFIVNESGSYIKVSASTYLQDQINDFDCYIDTVNLFYDISEAHVIKDNPISLFVTAAVSMLGTELQYTTDSNYRMNSEVEFKLNGQELETGSFSNTNIYTHGSKQVEVLEVEAIDMHDNRCVKFRIKAKLANSEMTPSKSYDDWRIFDVKYTPTNLFYVDGE